MRETTLLIATLILLLFSGCNGEKDTFSFRKTEYKYIEFVREDATCEKHCIEEYIIHSNGVTLIKKHFRGRMPEIIIGTIPLNKAEALIQATGNLIRDEGNEGIECTECRIYHIFYGDKEKTNAYTVNMTDAPDKIKDLEEEIRENVEEINEMESFFVHFIYKKPGEYAVDYHFYPEGTVLYEEFGQGNGELIKSAIYTISPEDVDFMRKETTDDFFNSKTSLENCITVGLEWGYLEIEKEDKYRLIYTCGTGNSTADALFNKLMEKTRK